MFWCRTIGELALYRDPTDPAPLMRAGKSLAILAYLGLTGSRRETRDRITDLFWPGADPAAAHHDLRQALYRLRTVTNGADVAAFDNGFVRLHDALRFDCLEGERALADGDLARAHHLLRGNFLEGFAIPRSHEFAIWARSQGDRFREGYARAAVGLVERLLGQRRPDEAIPVAAESVHANPLDERRVRLLVTALDRAGRTREALAQCRAFTTLLREQLEDEPTAEFRAYVDELERSLAPTAPSGPAPLPFVGRARAWAVLHAAWESAMAGTTRTVLLEGDGGLGKTRLIEEFATRLGARGAAWIPGKCYEVEQDLPFAVVSDLLEAARRSASVPSAGDGVGTQAAYRDAVIRAVRAASDARPLFVTCDDIHWADPASLRLLHTLAHRLRDARVLLVCAYRPAELSPAARRFAGSIATGEGSDLVRLDPLAPTDVAELLRTMGEFAEPTAADHLASDLWGHTGGNPLFVAELLQALEHQGTVTLARGRWNVRADLAPDAFPKSVRKILSDRVETLEPEARAALEAAAVAVDPCSADFLAAVLGASAPATERALTRLARERLARPLPFGHYGLAHDELRQLVYAGLPDDRRRDLHRRVALALEREPGAAEPGCAARLARHFEQAGDAGRARALALLAADQAGAIGAPEARRAFRERAESYAPVPPRPAAWQRFGVPAVIGVAMGGVLLAMPPVRERLWRPPPYTQGTLYLAFSHQPSGEVLGSRISQMRWPRRGSGRPELVHVARRPAELGPELLARPVSDGRETHTKQFRVRGADTVQLTFGNTDDATAFWSPDRRWIAVQRGWREGDGYRFDTFVLDSNGRDAWRVTNGPEVDVPIGWSPDGGRIVIGQSHWDRATLWVADVDGGNARDLTTEFGLPTDKAWAAAFDPSGRTMAAGRQGATEILLLALDRRTLERRALGCALVAQALIWSPDGRWIVAACRDSPARYHLIALAADGSSLHDLLDLPDAWSGFAGWLGEGPRFLERLHLRADTVSLSIGDGHPVAADALDPLGRTVYASLRWSTRDTSVARVDSVGFVRGRRPGTTTLVVTAGGVRTDSASIHVFPMKVDTLLYEDWSRGLDTRRWSPFGYPQSETVSHAGSDGTGALLSNGDFNWPSGVLSARDFDVAEGITVELPIRLRFTGELWQDLGVHLVPRDSALIAGERNPAMSIATMVFQGHRSDLGTSPTYSCGATAEWPATAAHRGWHQLALQVRPDWFYECYLDGRFLGAFPIPETRRPTSVALMLEGRTNKTRIYHGPVLVTRGLRY